MKDTYLAALKLLARQGYSRSKLRQKLLSKKLGPEAIELALDQLEAERYLREDEYRQQLVGRLLLKKWSPSMIQEKLQQQALQVTADEMAAIQSKLQITPEEAIRSLIRRKLPSSLPTERLKQLQLLAKIGRFLQSKGYRYEEFRHILATEIRERQENE